MMHIKLMISCSLEAKRFAAVTLPVCGNMSNAISPLHGHISSSNE